jgi:hypothetical protein
MRRSNLRLAWRPAEIGLNSLRQSRASVQAVAFRRRGGRQRQRRSRKRRRRRTTRRGPAQAEMLRWLTGLEGATARLVRVNACTLASLYLRRSGCEWQRRSEEDLGGPQRRGIPTHPRPLAAQGSHVRPRSSSHRRKGWRRGPDSREWHRRPHALATAHRNPAFLANTSDLQRLGDGANRGRSEPTP